MAQSSAQPLKTVLITGCSAGGIGSALVEAFHDRGLHVFATARSLSKISHLEKLPNVTLIQLDVLSSTDIAAAVEAVTTKTGGKLDYLVNNSGQVLVMPALDTDVEQARKLFDVNVWGLVNVTNAFAPLVIAAKGSIVNMASIAGLLHLPYHSFYSATKAAVKSYSEALRVEMAPLGVKVVTSLTGSVGTNIFANAPRVELPADSQYKGASKEINEFAAGQLISGAMSPSVFARRLVNDVLGGASGPVSRGTMSSVARFIVSFVPTWILDRMVCANSGLDHL